MKIVRQGYLMNPHSIYRHSLQIVCQGMIYETIVLLCNVELKGYPLYPTDGVAAGNGASERIILPSIRRTYIRIFLHYHGLACIGLLVCKERRRGVTNKDVKNFYVLIIQLQQCLSRFNVIR